MLVLGIETSCDETAAAVVNNGRKILSNIVSSSLKFHKKYGGVVPEIASRTHIETISFVVKNALSVAKLDLRNIDLIAVTDKPGLPGSLLAGISFAKALTFQREIPKVNVDHLHSHIYASFLNGNTPKLPFVALVVSGGHTSLFLVKDFTKIKILGATLDDACGETFDKVAKILGLGYPGGPIIENLAKESNSHPKINFSCGKGVGAFNFSFSGIKTAVLYYFNNQKAKSRSLGARAGALRELRANIAYSFQEAVIDSLIKKSLLACKNRGVRRLIIGGGVAANSRLRERLKIEAKEEDIKVYFPTKELCMDNAAMVAGMGYRIFKQGRMKA